MLEHPPPRVIRHIAVAPDSGDLALREIEADGVSLEAVNAPFALFQIDRIAREIPMVDAVAIRVEVQPLLADRGSGEDERPEGGIERIPDAAETCNGAFLILIVGEAHRETAAHLELLA